VQLFTTLARAAEQRMADFDAQALSNTAWAFAQVTTVDQKDLLLFSALGSTAEQRLQLGNIGT